MALLPPGTTVAARFIKSISAPQEPSNGSRARVREILDVGNLLNASQVLLQNNTYGSNCLRPAYILSGRLIKPLGREAGMKKETS
jgi:hypothetical protein